jgi:hypothetical protein
MEEFTESFRVGNDPSSPSEQIISKKEGKGGPSHHREHIKCFLEGSGADNQGQSLQELTPEQFKTQPTSSVLKTEAKEQT